MAFVFSNADDELYPFLNDEGEVPLSPDDQALLMGMYPGANLTDFDFAMMGPNGVVQQHHAAMHPQHPQHYPGHSPSRPGTTAPSTTASPNDPTMNITMSVAPSLERTKMPGLVAPAAAYYDPRLYQQQQQGTGHLPQMPANMTMGIPPAVPHSVGAVSPPYSPLGTPSSDTDGGGGGSLRDSEDILTAPVKSLTDEEKKLRRRAQVAKSARKHRNRQKEELIRLREQVQLLQEQMATMKARSGSIEMEKDAITMHRKRKKVDDVDVSLEAALSDRSGFASAAQRLLDNSMVTNSTIQHGYHHLSVDTLERTKSIKQIALKRAQHARQALYNEFGTRVVQYPQMDIKLNSNGPDMEIKLVRTKAVPGFNHLEVADAAWNSVFNFDLAIPPRFQPYVTCERLMELDDHTRYGRTIIPLLKNREENFIVYMHSYFVVHKVMFEDCVIITWESIGQDDLYPFEPTDTALRNDEVGIMVLETETKPSGEVQTLARTIIHSTPPVTAITEPRGRVNEAFLTVFCRNADILETSARLYLRKKYPDRKIRTEFETIQG